MKFTNRSKALATSLSTLALAASTACVPTVEQKQAIQDVFAGGPPSNNIPLPVTPPGCFADRFFQPLRERSKSVDLLFVIHSTGSFFNTVNSNVINGLNAFVANLPSSVDYHIAVMLAAAPTNPLHGRLYSASGHAKVLSSQSMSLSQIQSELDQNMLNTPIDSTTHAEEGLLSFNDSLSGSNLAANQNDGFYRPGAALAVVFMANEGDQCSLPQVSNPTGDDVEEQNIMKRDCPGVNATSVFNKLKQFEGSNPFAVASVVYTDPNTKDGQYEAEYGYGYVDIAALSSGIDMDIVKGNFSAGLSDLGNLLTVKLQLFTDFVLNHNGVDPNSLHAYVDGKAVTFSYTPAINDVHLNQVGGAGSVIDIVYCQNGVTGTTGTTGGTGAPGPSGSTGPTGLPPS